MCQRTNQIYSRVLGRASGTSPPQISESREYLDQHSFLCPDAVLLTYGINIVHTLYYMYVGMKVCVHTYICHIGVLCM